MKVDIPASREETAPVSICRRKKRTFCKQWGAPANRWCSAHERQRAFGKLGGTSTPVRFSMPGTLRRGRRNRNRPDPGGERTIQRVGLPGNVYKGVEQLPTFEDLFHEKSDLSLLRKDSRFTRSLRTELLQVEYGPSQASRRRELNAGDSLGGRGDVKNTSARDGDEVVELYLSFPETAWPPCAALRGFNRSTWGAAKRSTLTSRYRRVNLSSYKRGKAIESWPPELTASGWRRAPWDKGRPGRSFVLGSGAYRNCRSRRIGGHRASGRRYVSFDSESWRP